MTLHLNQKLHDNHVYLARYYSQLAEQFPQLKNNPDLVYLQRLASDEPVKYAGYNDASFQQALKNFRGEYSRYTMGRNAQWCGDNPGLCELDGMAARGVLTSGKIVGGTIDGFVSLGQHVATRGHQVRTAVDVPVLGDLLGVAGAGYGFLEAVVGGAYHACTDVVPSIAKASYDSVAHPEYSNMQLADEWSGAVLNVHGVLGALEVVRAAAPRVQAGVNSVRGTWSAAVDAVRNNIDSNGGLVLVSGAVEDGVRANAAVAALPPDGGIFGPLAAMMSQLTADEDGLRKPAPAEEAAVALEPEMKTEGEGWAKVLGDADGWHKKVLVDGKWYRVERIEYWSNGVVRQVRYAEPLGNGYSVQAITTNPDLIRKIVAKLKEAGVDVERLPRRITLGDGGIYDRAKEFDAASKTGRLYISHNMNYGGAPVGLWYVEVAQGVPYKISWVDPMSTVRFSSHNPFTIWNMLRQARKEYADLRPLYPDPEPPVALGEEPRLGSLDEPQISNAAKKSPEALPEQELTATQIEGDSLEIGGWKDWILPSALFAGAAALMNYCNEAKSQQVEK